MARQHKSKLGNTLQTVLLTACLLAGAHTAWAAAPDMGSIVVFAGQSQLFSTPWPTQRLSVTDPKTADVEAISPRQILILARKVGATDLVMWGVGGEVMQRRIEVRLNIERLERELAQSLPKARLTLSQSEDVVTVNGVVSNQEQYERLNNFLVSAQRATGVEHVNMAEIAGNPGPGLVHKGDPTPVMTADALYGELMHLFPDAELEVRQAGDVITVSGRLRRAEQVEQLSQLLAALENKDAWSGPAGLATSRPADVMPAPSPRTRFLNMASLAGPQQVQLQVKVAEVSRTAIRALGINALQTGHHDNTWFGASVIGPDQGGAINPINIGPPGGALAGPENTPFTFNAPVGVSPLVTTFFGFPRAELQFFLQALAENQYLRLLAEPTLVALSGEEASFLAGGEFPIPVVQGGGTVGTVSITIEYKEFGVRLRFRPTVLGDGSIRLHVAPEVSDLTDSGAVVIQGFRVPALMTRRAETTLELKSGQTFSMAGLLNDRNDGRSSRVPGLGDVPVLGALFRSTRYVKGETELVVLVTASLVEPLSLADPPALPGVLDVVPNDWEFYMEGLTEGRERPHVTAPEAKWLEGIGFEGLQGPGAWETYETAQPQCGDDVQ